MELNASWALANNDFRWQDRAACKGIKDVFFSVEGRPDKRHMEAKLICIDCPVRAECLKFALDNQFGSGVWGGATPQERLRILNKKSWTSR